MSAGPVPAVPSSVPITPGSTRPAGTKVAGAAAAVLAVALFMTVATLNVPHEPSDAELLAWWQDPANRMSGLISGAFALVVAVSIPVVLNHLHGVRQAARSPQWLAFARSMGTAVTAVYLVTGSLRGSTAYRVDTMKEPLPGTDVLRFTTGLNYVLLGEFGMTVLALCALATSAVVLRTGALGRWAGYAGVACSVVMIGAVAARVGAYATPVAILWALCLAVAIWKGPSADHRPERDRPAR